MTKENEQQLLPAYLVTGTDELKRQTVVKRLLKRLEKEGDISFNSDVFDGKTAEGSDIVAACNTLPFASNIRLVQVNAADSLKNDDQTQIIDYLNAPCETTVLCLITTGLAKNTRLYKAVAAIGKTAIIDCAPPKLRELPSRVRAMATAHGVTITESAANLLIDLVGESTIALDAELHKLSLAHRGSDPINDSEVNEMVSRTAEVKPWEFVDAFSARNLEKCLMLRSRMESVSPYALLAQCVARIRHLIIAKTFDERGQVGGLAGYLGMPDWRVKNYGPWSRLYSGQELRQALLSARDTEQSMKSGADAEEAFMLWYVGVVSR